MTIIKVPEQHFPKAELGRRAMGLGIDFLVTWLISSVFGSGEYGVQFLQIFVFITVWLILRVILPYNNKGQSLGRWAVDLKVLDLQDLEFGRGRIPSLLSLAKREAIIGLCLLLVSIAIANIRRNPTAILLVIPLVIDCGAAFSDTQARLALHDRFAGTMIVSSRRGYSLDLKIKRLVETMRQNMRR
ncbi:RDD family protein [Calothrix sp. UHCC 0171]|uniref:RDD family protein n=1 Tax=Calothrix sp. UHCC 0171 TaxID=3110245 RepID=UPI002B20D332|nr:RDD family protein [Calothrix sp. UHCC 0171]MEA5571731.1 RDD family protein [Calothrix sp. UHCC 0171]